ncbi:6-phosphogluconolactonase [Psychromonas sp.]|uniref:6-phosphogluconolactonase n=1 Tax=Psychromonas sp. TaxID=1884585 RepID=UPI003568F505
MRFTIFSSTQLLLEQLAKEFLLLSLQAKVSHVSLPGGLTPILLFNYLAQSAYAEKINWQKLHFWWGDERCVAAYDPESNFGQCKKLLLDKVAIPAENIHSVQGEKDPYLEAIRYAAEIKEYVAEVNGRPQFDWVILGMGGDGHTASLFPGQTDYLDTHLTVVAKHPQSGQLRISKSAYLIENSKHITYLVLGESKADIIDKIHNEPAESYRYPAAKITAATGQTQYYLNLESAKLLMHRQD